MTPVFCCGFECGVTNSAHFALAGASSFSASTVRSGSRSLRLNPAAASTAAATYSHITGAQTRWVGRFYVRFTALPDADTQIAVAGSVGTSSCAIRFKLSDSKIYAAIGSTIGATGVAVTTGVWYRIDFDFNFTAGNDTSDVKVDGVSCGQVSSETGAADAAAMRLALTSAVTADVFYEDFMLSLTGADYPLGAGYVNHFVPTADGTHNVAGTGDFQRTLTGTDILNATTTAFQLVDEVPLEATVTDWINMLAPVNATDYVECIFGPAPGIQIPIIGPRAVEVIAGINQSGTGAGNMEIRLNDNGSMGTVYTATGVAGVAVATGQQFKRAHFADPPSAASTWNAGSSGNGAFNNVRVRFGSPAALDVNPDQYFGCIMIEAEFADQLDAAAFGRPAGQLGQQQFSQLLAQ